MPNDAKFMGMTENNAQFVVNLDIEGLDPGIVLNVKQVGDDYMAVDAQSGAVLALVTADELNEGVDDAKMEAAVRNLRQMELEVRLAETDDPVDYRLAFTARRNLVIAHGKYVQTYAEQVTAALGRIMGDQVAGSAGTAGSPAVPTPLE